MEAKPWYQSKMIWTNLAALVTAIGLWAEQGFSLTALGATVFPAALAILNLILRLVTKQPVE